MHIRNVRKITNIAVNRKGGGKIINEMEGDYMTNVAVDGGSRRCVIRPVEHV